MWFVVGGLSVRVGVPSKEWLAVLTRLCVLGVDCSSARVVGL